MSRHVRLTVALNANCQLVWLAVGANQDWDSILAEADTDPGW